MATRIEKLNTLTDEGFQELVSLSQTLHEDSRTANREDVEALLHNKDAVVFVVRDGEQVVGMGMLYIIQKIGNRTAYIEDVIVGEKYRGQGLGEKLTLSLIAEARLRGVKSITLSSRADRVPAHALYQKLGFKTRNSKLFKLILQ